MIAQQHRFHGHASLRHVYQQGQTIRTPALSLRFLLNSHRKSFRVAIVVSTKVDKSAVVRNRIRRRLYEQIRGHQTQITEPYDLVFTVFNNQVAEMPTEKLVRLVHQQLTKARIINSSTNFHHAIVE